MERKLERKFGHIPEWAKTGYITPKNYDYRAEAHCFLKSAERAGQHPTLTLESPDFATWREYFDDHLGGRPWAFMALVNGQIKYMTLPEQVPQWFDPSFEAAQSRRA